LNLYEFKIPSCYLDVLSTLKRVANVRYVLPEGLSHQSKDLINRILQKDAKKRLTLIQIRNHPFLLKRSINDRMNSSRNSCTVCTKRFFCLE
jgi:serine/threonine protein kinase